jgi:hypothetical protein
MPDDGRVTLSVWLRSARPAEGGLFVPGRTQRSACDVLIHPGGVRLGSGDLVVHLPYEAYAAADGDSWWLDRWTWGRSGSIGVGVEGAGSYAAPVAALRRRHRTYPNLVDRLADRANVAPLYAARTINGRVDADRDALQMLCRRLAGTPAWRPQLGDPARVGRLLHDLASHDHASIEPSTGLRRRAMETLMVMQQQGFRHAARGRPMPDDPRPDGDEVVDVVLRRLAANPLALAVDEEYTRALVHRHYLDVTPWPFAALVPEGVVGT